MREMPLPLNARKFISVKLQWNPSATLIDEQIKVRKFSNHVTVKNLKL